MRTQAEESARGRSHRRADEVAAGAALSHRLQPARPRSDRAGGEAESGSGGGYLTREPAAAGHRWRAFPPFLPASALAGALSSGGK